MKMDQLSTIVKSADIESAKIITTKLYLLVDEKTIPNFNIKKISRGKNSVDLTPLIPILGDVDFETAYQTIKESGIITAGKIYLGIKIAREILSIVKDGIWAYEKIQRKKSKFGINCKINNLSIIKYGRSFGIEPFDTIMTSASPESLKSTFLDKKKWGEIPMAQSRYFNIEYVAIFVKHPVGAITHYGKVKHIDYNPKNGKSTIILDGDPIEISPIPYDENFPHHNAHGTLYTTMARLKKAKTLADIYPSLDDRKK